MMTLPTITMKTEEIGTQYNRSWITSIVFMFNGVIVETLNTGHQYTKSDAENRAMVMVLDFLPDHKTLKWMDAAVAPFLNT